MSLGPWRKLEFGRGREVGEGGEAEGGWSWEQSPALAPLLHLLGDSAPSAPFNPICCPLLWPGVNLRSPPPSAHKRPGSLESQSELLQPSCATGTPFNIPTFFSSAPSPISSFRAIMLFDTDLFEAEA